MTLFCDLPVDMQRNMAKVMKKFPIDLVTILTSVQIWQSVYDGHKYIIIMHFITATGDHWRITEKLDIGN